MSGDITNAPKGWARTSLANVGVWGSGGTPSRGDEKGYGGLIPWLKIGDLPDGPVNTSEETITEHGLSNSAAKLLEPDTLLVAMYGSIGKLGITKMQCATNQAIAFCRPHEGLDLNYLFYLLMGERRRFINEGQGGTQLNISQTILKAHEVPIAPSHEQARIASKIDELFSDIEEGERALARVQKLVERYRQSVLKAAVTGELTRAWREQHKGKLEPGEALLQRILKARRQAWEKAELDKMKAKGQKPVNDNWKQKYQEPSPPDTTDLPELPVGWVWASTDQICSSVRDGTHETPKYVTDGIPLITSKNLLSSGLDFRDVQFISHEDHVEISRRSAVASGDILFAMIGTIGNPVVVMTEREFSIKNVGLFKSNFAVYYSGYLRHWLGSPSFNAWIEPRKKGTSQKFAPLGLLRALPVPLPPLDEQCQIVEQVDQLLLNVGHLSEDLSRQQMGTQMLRQATLRSAFSGELLKQDPTDEPASILLERIAAERGAANATPKRGRKPGKRA